MTTLTKNDVLLEGTPLAVPEWSHENHGTQFYRLLLEVPRLSGTPDTLPLLLPKALAARVRVGEPLRVRGQLRSFNNRSGVGNKLVLTVYAQELQPGTGGPCNQITLSGSLCKPPIFRRTPLGRSICDLMLAVRTSQLQVGDGLSLEGRVQSRTYHKVTEDGSTQERVAYEVSMMHLLSPEP